MPSGRRPAPLPCPPSDPIAAGARSQLTSMRSRIRERTRASSGANARPKKKLATVSVMS